MADALDAARAASGRPILCAIAGGATPIPVLKALAARNLDWRSIVVTPTDERLTDDLRFRNDAMIAGALGGVHITPLAHIGDGSPPDVVLLGFGADRHVASVFPTGPGMSEACNLAVGPSQAIVVATPDPLPTEAPYARRTFTLGALARAREVFIAAQGPSKMAVFQSALKESPPTSPLSVLINARVQAGLPCEALFAEDPAHNASASN